MSRSLNIVIGSTMLAIFLLAGCGNESEASKEESEANGNPEMQQNGGQGFAQEELTDEQIIEMAENAGIDTDGKTIEEIEEEMKEIRPNPNEKLTDEQIIERAEQAGIDTEGKSIEEIQEELREAMPEMGKDGGKLNVDDVKEQAEEAGIETEGKTIEEIQTELQESQSTSSTTENEI